MTQFSSIRQRLANNDEGVVGENAIGDDCHNQTEIGKIVGKLIVVGIVSLFHGLAGFCSITLNLVVATAGVCKIYTVKNCELCLSSRLAYPAADPVIMVEVHHQLVPAAGSLNKIPSVSRRITAKLRVFRGVLAARIAGVTVARSMF